MRSEPVGRGADEGFTLLEVLVSMVVVSAAMAGLGAFYVNGTLTVAQQRDQRQAAQLANNALEQVRALEGSSLLNGRDRASVQEQWNYGATGPFKDKMLPYLKTMAPPTEALPLGMLAYDNYAAAGKGEDAPVSTAPQTITTGGMTFQQRTFVGGCEVYVRRTDKCTRPLAEDDPKRPDSSAVLSYFRVVVLITWPHKSCTTTGGECGFVASTMVTPEKGGEKYSDKRATPVIRKPSMEIFYRGRSNVSVLMQAKGGNLPNTWSAVNLPDGLTINKDTGLVSGTPTKTGTWSFAKTGTLITVKESTPPAGVLTPRSDTDKEDGSVWKVIEPPTVTVTGPTGGYPDTAVTLTAVGKGEAETLPFTYSVAEKTPLPTGFTLDETTGVIKGTPTKNFSSTIIATDKYGQTAEVVYTYTVYQPMTIQPIANQEITALSTLTLNTVVAGGDGKYTYTASGLPAELAINATTGVISGLPVIIPGRYLPTVTVTDGLGNSVSTSFELVVAASANSLSITSPASVVKSVRGQQVTLPVITNADAIDAKGVKVAVVGLLPLGTSWNNGKDTISGAPTLPGTYLVTLSATSSKPAQTVLYTFTWIVS
ncbi:putative Ig domain-containing protein [Actinoplanes sp. NBC_00393]|uniref:putative Ig domain-containing protein n=1 Tax=Actinoplanes sp. NBC_00393 TaxID=2975953 RepID=UPI002E1A5EA7